MNLLRKLILVCACAVLWLTSCRHAPSSNQSDPVDSAIGGIAGVVAHTESAERHVQQAIPYSDTTGRFHLASASDEHQDVLVSADQTMAALNDARNQVAELQADLIVQRAAVQKLDGRWYVRWGRRIERALWIIGVSWLILGALSVLLGIGNPLGWGMHLSREIVRLVPLMNPFTWVRDYLIKRRHKETP